MNLFLIAAKNRYRFQTPKGSLNVEQLFQLGKTELHELYLSLESGIQKSKGLLGRSGNVEVENKMQIVKEVFDSVVKDEKAVEKSRGNAKLKQVILQKVEEVEISELIDGKSAKQLKKIASKL